MVIFEKTAPVSTPITGFALYPSESCNDTPNGLLLKTKLIAAGEPSDKAIKVDSSSSENWSCS